MIPKAHLAAFLSVIVLTSAGQCDESRTEKGLDHAFDKLKSLAGQWVSAAPEPGDKQSAVVIFRVVAGGNAVMETLFPGTEKEMVSMYHRDGDALLMTHYCVAGNQPRMRARPDKASDTVVFGFDGGTNLDVDKDMHVHNGQIRWVSNDEIETTWTYYIDGQAAGEHAFNLVRKP